MNSQVLIVYKVLGVLGMIFHLGMITDQL